MSSGERACIMQHKYVVIHNNANTLSYTHTLRTTNPHIIITTHPHLPSYTTPYIHSSLLIYTPLFLYTLPSHTHRVLTALRQACIMPHITLYHWDLPQPLYDEYKGWISPKIQGDYEEYARTVFAALGEYAEHWCVGGGGCRVEGCMGVYVGVYVGV